MKKEHFHRWIRERVASQVNIIYAAMAAMIVLGLLGLLIQGGLLYLIFKLAWGRAVGIMVPLLTFSAMGYFTCLIAPKILCDSVHEGKVDGKPVKVRVAPTMAACWTFAMGSLEADRSFLEKLLGVMLIVPRLFWTAWYLFQRVEDVKQIDVPEAAKVLRLALKKAERVDLDDFADRFTSMDLPKILRQVSLIDGVVFLTKRGFGMSLANRFTEDVQTGIERIQKQPLDPPPSDEFQGA